MSQNMESVEFIEEKTRLNPKNIASVLNLLIDEECTIPFVARYRKDRIGGLDEVAVTQIFDMHNEYTEIVKRKSFILETLKKAEKLNPDLEKKIKMAWDLKVLEDLYAPYKTKKKTKAQIAIEAGLEPLSKLIVESGLKIQDIQLKHAKDFIDPEKGIKDFEQALDGASQILIEGVVHDIDLKNQLRDFYWKSAQLKSSKATKAEEVKDFQKYRDYFEFEQKVSELKLPKNGHRFLAIRRALLQKVLKVEITIDEESVLNFILASKPEFKTSACKEFINNLSRQAMRRIHLSLDLEIKSELKKSSDESAVQIFGINLRNLLLQPYLGQFPVMGIDPGVRTGCKVVVIDKNGNFLEDTIIYPHPPQEKKRESLALIEHFVAKYQIEFIAIGNGTFGRETLHFLNDNKAKLKSEKLKMMLVNEDGASIYSASDIAREEFPDKDLTVRGAISIARRFQDPLAELVKIDPKSIGVGQYQHDVSQSLLKKSLGHVVESCVNFVGVDLNTASAPLLSYISGIGPGLAKNIVKKRMEVGGFKSREELLSVSRLTEKVYQQSAGFLRIYNGLNPLDSTFIHPESYKLIQDWCDGKGIDVQSLIKDKGQLENLEKDGGLKESLGEMTFEDIIKSLKAPSQDPRSEFQPFEFREDLKSINDLKESSWYPGLVTNITKFGAFVDIGIKENGLLHLSQIADKFVEDPTTVLKVGQEVKVRVIEFDLERKRISLSLRKEGSEEGHRGKKERSSSPSTSQRPQKSGGNRSHQGKRPNNVQLKNNAFSKLKNFKVKS